MMKRTVIVALAALFAALPSYAQGEAMTWMAQEKTPVAASTPGLSLTSSSDISFAAFHSPAVVPYSSDRLGVAASYSLTGNAGTGSGVSAGVATRLGKRIGIAVAGNYNLCGEYEVIDDFGNRNGLFKTSSMMFSAGVGVKVIEMLSLGVNLKYAGERLASDSTPAAFASDVYALFRWKGLGVSAGVSNVGTSVKDQSGAAFSLPSSVRVAVGYGQTFASSHFLEAGLEADYFFSGKFSAAAGLQYGFRGFLFARAGYRWSDSPAVPSYASAGLGCKFFGVSLNISGQFTSSKSPNTLALSLGYSF